LKLLRALLRQVFRHVLVWWLPCIAGLMVVLAALLSWTLGTQAGAVFLLRTVATHFEGEVRGIRGSVLDGLSVDKLRLTLPDLTLDAEGAHLAVAWRALSLRTLHVREFSLDSLHLALTPSTSDGTGTDVPATPPASPVTIVVDRLALGQFTLTQDGAALPVSLGEIAAQGRWDEAGLSLALDNLAVGHAYIDARISGAAHLAELGAPWPMQVTLAAQVRGPRPDSPLCAALRGVTDTGDAPCVFRVDMDANGSLDALALAVRAEGGGLQARAEAELDSYASLPVRQARLEVALANGSGLTVSLQPESIDTADDRDAPLLRERLYGTLSARRFDVTALWPGAIPSALLTAQGRFSLEALARKTLTHVELTLDIAAGSIWNDQALSGHLAASVTNPTQDWTQLRVTRLDTDMSLGQNRLQTRGDFGTSQANLTVNIQAPRLADLWPGLPGGASVQGKLGGSIAHHEAELHARHTLGASAHPVRRNAPVSMDLLLTGGWQTPPNNAPAQDPATLAGWRGQVRALHLAHADTQIVVAQPVALTWLPQAQAPAWPWQIGAGEATVKLPGEHTITITHQGSRAGPGRWESTGAIKEFLFSRPLVREVRKLIDPNFQPAPIQARGSSASNPPVRRGIGLNVTWDLRFNGALAGKARITRRSGDLRIPGDPPSPLGLRELALTIQAAPAQASASRLDLGLTVTTESMGRVDATAWTILRGLTLDPRQTIHTTLNADISNLAWLALLTGDSLDMSGRLNAQVEGQGSLDGPWTSTGTIKGEALRVVRIDDGMRLLDGTLAMRLDNHKVILESLRFPAVRRITPSEWRTRTWIAEEADAQNGELRASGHWDLAAMAGDIQIVLHRFPILQRTDRYAMMSGQVDLAATLPSLRISGSLTADAGWVSPEIAASVPTVDDDVTVRRANDKVDVPSNMDVGMDLTVDLGPRFYVVGMGIDAGLVGRIQIMLDHKRLTGLGAFRTRGGRFEAYGQRLHVRRGLVIFNGSLANPRLDIEALRLGEQVEAGVRVIGTAQRPRIDLVSYPDVSDVDKLSWLILGRGADQSGSDAALLVSLGTSLFGGGEPFYRRFGLDDVGIKTGVMGSSGSLLPDTTVAGSVARASNAELETQFMYASTRFANLITLSIEQALAGAQTVGRASYLLARGLSVDVKGGSVNGLALVYRTFWGD